MINKKSNYWKMIIAGIISIMFSAGAFAEKYSEGFEYDKLSPAVSVSTDSVEVRELFWYGCPHCYQVENPMRRWVMDRADIEFVKHPAVFSKKWLSGAKFYYILKDLGMEEDLGMKLFSDMHDKKINISNTKVFVKWLKENGVSDEVADKYINNFSVFVKASKAKRNTTKYKISGVPTVVVDGKYKTSPSQAGSIDKMKKILDFLVEKAKKERNTRAK